MLPVVYFDQLLGAARAQKLVETFFSDVFQRFDKLLGARSTQKLVEIHNTIYVTKFPYETIHNVLLTILYRKTLNFLLDAVGQAVKL